MKYIVWYNGEEDMDECGNVIVAHRIFEDYDEARKSAESHEHDTGYIATIEFLCC